MSKGKDIPQTAADDVHVCPPGTFADENGNCAEHANYHASLQFRCPPRYTKTSLGFCLPDFVIVKKP
ncbi:UNVERIFIED_CONTAM: hypothetical protein PYX00_003941 [Menopon gallinae]|uniref:Chitin-binding type-2 domain-containing protein n=1 Tax=Menopon gallinae TaxID=328185 RepID=A0AAW2I2G9_9NEOP